MFQAEGMIQAEGHQHFHLLNQEGSFELGFSFYARTNDTLNVMELAFLQLFLTTTLMGPGLVTLDLKNQHHQSLPSASSLVHYSPGKRFHRIP